MNLKLFLKNNSVLKRWKRGSLQRTSFTSNTKLSVSSTLDWPWCLNLPACHLSMSEKLTSNPLIPCSSLNPWPQTKSGHRSPRLGQNPWRRVKCLSPKQIWENECEDASFKDRNQVALLASSNLKRENVFEDLEAALQCWGIGLGDSQTKSGGCSVGQAEEIISPTHEDTKRSATIWWKPHSQQKEEGKLHSVKGLGHSGRLCRHI